MFNYKSIGFEADISEFITAKTVYYDIENLYDNAMSNFLNYSLKARLPVYPLYVQLMLESDYFNDHSTEYLDISILYRNVDYDISVRMGNAEKYAFSFIAHNQERIYGFEIGWYNLLYSNVFRELNLFDYNKSNTYALMAGSVFDSEHIGWKVMGGSNNKYRIIMIPEISFTYNILTLRCNALIASQTFIYMEEYYDKSNSDSYVDFSIEIGITL